MNIAIIDDNATDRILLSSFLKRYLKENDILNSATINEFESGEDFFASYTSNFFQIIFIDCYMFGISGIFQVKNTDDGFVTDGHIRTDGNVHKNPPIGFSLRRSCRA